MLRAGGFRPWELELLTPDEESALHEYGATLDQEL